jgi:hypothetical protein
MADELGRGQHRFGDTTRNGKNPVKTGVLPALELYVKVRIRSFSLRAWL